MPRWVPENPDQWPAQWGVLAEQSALYLEPFLVDVFAQRETAWQYRQDMYKWKFDLRHRGTYLNGGHSLERRMVISIDPVAHQWGVFIDCPPLLETRLVALNPWMDFLLTTFK